MTTRNFAIIAGLAAAICLTAVFAIFVLAEAPRAQASAPIGLPATVATSSTLSVGPQNNVWTGLGTTTPTAEARQQCAARIITTVGQPIMLSFGAISSTTLSQTVGHQQAASTTVAYDSGLYGCGYLTVRGLNASTTITITETR